jgi:hypothetical protein
MIAPVLSVLTLAVLTLAAPMEAWAECAWVLWTQTTTMAPDGTDNVWEVGLATSAEDRCNQLREANVRARTEMLRKSPLAGKAEPGEAGSIQSDRASVTLYTGRGFISTRYVCLPGTIDPRGPKGGGR